MATNQYSPQLRPLGVGEVLDASFKVVRSSFGTLALCVLVVAVPLNILSTLISASTNDRAFEFGTTAAANSSNTGSVLAGVLLNGALSVVVLTLAAAACFRAVSGTYLGQRPTWQESLSFAAKRLGPLIVLSILYTLAVLVGFVALILPGIWLSVALALSYPAMLSEGLGPMESLGRSRKLVSGRWWATFGALLVMYILIAVIGGIVGLVVGGTLGASTDNEVVSAVVLTLVNIVSSLITLPLVAAVLTIIYFDLRVRKEGFDLQLLAQGVGEDSSRYGTSPESVAASSGLGDRPPAAPHASSVAPPGSGGFAPPQAPARPSSDGDVSQGDPLREPGGGASS